MAKNDALRRVELQKLLQFLQEKERRIEAVLETSNVPEIRDEAKIELEQTLQQIGSVVTELKELGEAL
jgi:hypothetical protein